MAKLETLQLVHVDFSWSIDTIFAQKVSFPSLKIWKFGGLWLSKDYLNLLVSNLTQFGPQLQLVDINYS